MCPESQVPRCFKPFIHTPPPPFKWLDLTPTPPDHPDYVPPPSPATDLKLELFAVESYEKTTRREARKRLREASKAENSQGVGDDRQAKRRRLDSESDHKVTNTAQDTKPVADDNHKVGTATLPPRAKPFQTDGATLEELRAAIKEVRLRLDTLTALGLGRNNYYFYPQHEDSPPKSTQVPQGDLFEPGWAEQMDSQTQNVATVEDISFESTIWQRQRRAQPETTGYVVTRQIY